jgi:hypothetical protein
MLKEILEETNSEMVNQWETETSDFSNFNHPDICWLTPTEARGGIFNTPPHNSIKGQPKEASFHLVYPSHIELSFSYCVVSCEEKKGHFTMKGSVKQRKSARDK